MKPFGVKKMVACRVVSEQCGYVVSFKNRTSLLLQSDYDYVAFAVNCGLIPAPDGWDGDPDKLDVKYWEYRFTDITKCPEEYMELAE